jgi:hypothetical protein
MLKSPGNITFQAETNKFRRLVSTFYPHFTIFGSENYLATGTGCCIKGALSLYMIYILICNVFGPQGRVYMQVPTVGTVGTVGTGTGPAITGCLKTLSTNMPSLDRRLRLSTF